MEKMQALVDAVSEYKTAKENLKDYADDHRDGRISDTEMKRQTNYCNDKWDNVTNALSRING